MRKIMVLAFALLVSAATMNGWELVVYNELPYPITYSARVNLFNKVIRDGEFPAATTYKTIDGEVLIKPSKTTIDLAAWCLYKLWYGIQSTPPENNEIKIGEGECASFKISFYANGAIEMKNTTWNTRTFYKAPTR